MKSTNTIEQSVFESVMEGMSCDTGDDLSTVGLQSELYGYIISIYGEQENGHELIVEEFGQFQKGEWISLEPTEEQMGMMVQLLKIEVRRIKEMQEQERNEEALAMQEDDDEMMFGHPGAIYSKWY